MERNTVCLNFDKNREFRRGEIYVANLDPVIGSEQGGKRPVVILQNNIGNIYSGTVIVAPVTSVIKKTSLPVHILVSCPELRAEQSMVLLEQIRTIDKCRVLDLIGKIKKEEMRDISEAIRVSLGVYLPEEVEAP